MDPTLAAHALGRTSLFAALEEPELLRLAQRCGTHTFGAGEIVFLRGDPGDCLYVVVRGSVTLSVVSQDGGEAVFALVHAPQAFGELALMDGGPRTATARARERSALLVVPRALALEMIEQHPVVAAAAMKTLVGMVRRVDDQVADLALLDLPRRVQKFLRNEATRSQDAGNLSREGCISVDLRLTQTEVAQQVGGSRQHVNRILMMLETTGAIERRGHRIVAIRPGLLVTDD